MSLETGTYISDLVATNPTSADPKSQGDDHIRLIKSAIKATFPNISGAVTPTHSELGYVAGVTGAIQTQINAKGAIAGQAWAGAHDFTSGTMTVAAPSIGSNPATKTYADNLAFSAALPGQSGNAGKIVTTNGTTASWSLIGSANQLIRVNAGGTALEGYTLNVNPQWQVKTTTYTASSGDAIQANTTSAAFTVTLPATPAANDMVRIADYAGTFATENLTVGRNGSNIMGLAEDMVISTNNASLALTYIDATQGWRII